LEPLIRVFAQKASPCQQDAGSPFLRNAERFGSRLLSHLSAEVQRRQRCRTSAGAAPGAGNAASDRLSFGPPPHLVVELAQADDKLLEAIRASPALFDARMRELIRGEVNRGNITPGAQKAATR
jgi:hypothetical protein